MDAEGVGVFFLGPPPSAEAVAAVLRDAQVTVERDERYTRITAVWPNVELRLTIDPEWPRAIQLAGMRRWIGEFAEELRTSAAVEDFLERLDRTTTCFGGWVAPRFDREGRVAARLLDIVRPSGGFFFCHQTFYDAQGVAIIGLPGAPERLGPSA